jgi:hypothetical protein
MKRLSYGLACGRKGKRWSRSVGTRLFTLLSSLKRVSALTTTGWQASFVF